MNTRRELLIKSIKGSLGLALMSALTPAIFSSCKKKNNDTTSSKEDSIVAERCAGQENLSADDKMLRTTLKYVDKSPQSDRTCDNCKLYTLPKNNDACGGCPVVPGPIHPKGYCTAWLHRM